MNGTLPVGRLMTSFDETTRKKEKANRKTKKKSSEKGILITSFRYIRGMGSIASTSWKKKRRKNGKAEKGNERSQIQPPKEQRRVM